MTNQRSIDITVTLPLPVRFRGYTMIVRVMQYPEDAAKWCSKMYYVEVKKFDKAKNNVTNITMYLRNDVIPFGVMQHDANNLAAGTYFPNIDDAVKCMNRFADSIVLLQEYTLNAAKAKDNKVEESTTDNPTTGIEVTETERTTESINTSEG